MKVETNNNSPVFQQPLEPLSRPKQTNRWKNAFVPKTSTWDEKPMCVDEFDENQNCCVSGYDIEAVVEQAYEDGLEDHPGVIALESRPCVSAKDLEVLADQLITMAPDEKEQVVQPKIPGIPEGLDPSGRTDVIFDKKILNFCASLVHRVTTISYGGAAELPEKITLGTKFDDVFKYCAKAISKRVSIVDILKNSFMDKKDQIENSAPFPGIFGR